MKGIRLTGATPPISRQHLFKHLPERTAMFVLSLKKDGTIYHQERAVDSDVLKYLRKVRAAWQAEFIFTHLYRTISELPGTGV